MSEKKDTLLFMLENGWEVHSNLSSGMHDMRNQKEDEIWCENKLLEQYKAIGTVEEFAAIKNRTCVQTKINNKLRYQLAKCKQTAKEDEE